MNAATHFNLDFPSSPRYYLRLVALAMAVPINSNAYDMTKVKPLTADDAAKTHFVLVQCSHPLNAGEHKQLLDKKVHIEAYLAEETYTCYFEQANLVLEAAKLPFVKIITVFPTALKIRAELQESLAAPPVQPNTGMFLFHGRSLRACIGIS